MAANYEPLGSYPDVEFLGGTLTRPVTVFRLRTIPNSVYAEMRVPTSLVKDIDLGKARTDFAASFEKLFGNPGVAGVAWGQEQNAADQLENVVYIYVSSTSGDSSATLSFPYTKWTPTPWLAAAAAEQAFLDQSEGV